MAMDSHDANEYKLLIDTVNNNRKTSSASDKRSANVECSTFASLVADTSSGSSRRKCAAVSKGITIEEFLETAENAGQLTAIDKLIMKNKAALVEDQTKRTRGKSRETPASQKTGEKKAKAKVLCSKVAAAKHKNQNGIKEPPAANAAKSGRLNPKPRPPATKDQIVKKSRNAAGPLRIEKRDRTGRNESARSPKKSGVAKTKQNGLPGRKSLLGGIRSLKKEPKVNCKSFDMKRLKTGTPYRTRSGNKEKLRNGKTRIYKDATDVLSLESTKKKRRADRSSVGDIVPPSLTGRPVTKRSIKQEPLDDDLGVPKRRRLVSGAAAAATVAASEKNNNKEETAAVASATSPTEFDELISKVEISETVKLEFVQPVKEELVVEPEPEHSNVVEINVNMNIVPHCAESEEFSLVCDTMSDAIKSELSAVTAAVDAAAEDVPVPNGLVLQDFCSLRDYETVKSPEDNEVLVLSPSSTEEDDTTSDSINLQIEERSCDSVESLLAESIGELPEAIPVEREKEEQRPEQDDSAKESMFNALGLQSIEKIHQRPKEREARDRDNYTGTLKAVIKTDKGCRRMEMKQKNCGAESTENESILSFYSKTIPNQSAADCVEDKSSLRCSSADNSNDDGSVISSLFVEEDADKEGAKKSSTHETFINVINEAFLVEEGCKNLPDETTDKIKAIATQPLVVPEKSSSFSIHPNRLCSDVCKYCFGKFGSLDTPCHVGQLKNLERQRKILMCEPNLKIDTCLCDACFRYVDRKANRPSIKRKTMRTSSMAQRTIVCAVSNCNQIASRHYSKRRWRSKISRKIANLSFDVRRRGSGMNWGLCTQHYCMLDTYTLCGICKKPLNRNDMYSIRSELNDLNDILKQDGIPANLVDNMLLCKYCHHCMSLRLKYGDPSLMSDSNRDYYKSFRKEMLRCHNVIVSDSEDTNSSEGLKSESCDTSSPERLNGKLEELVNGAAHDSADGKLSNGGAAALKKNHNVDIHEIASLLKPLEGDHAHDKNATRIQLKFGNLNIGKLSNLNIGQNAPPQPDAKHEKCAAGEKELPLIADFSFDNADPSSKNWERCVSTIQFDKGTKKLWQDLQKPYGNQSSFIRHLIMLEKYWRSGALTLSETADAGAVKYINSVKNRVESLETSQAPKLAAAPPKPVYTTPPTMLKSTPPPLQPAPKPCVGPIEMTARHASTPPPLLKLNCAPFAVRKPTPVCAVRPSSDAHSLLAGKQMLPAPPQLEKMPSQRPYNPKMMPVVMHDYRHIVQTLPRNRLPSSVSVFGPMRGIPFAKKPPMTNGNAVVRTVSPTSYTIKAYPKMASQPTVQSNASSMLIAKLPKALTVTQIDERVPKERPEAKQPLIAAPFMVGEKPSVTVFREMSK